LQSYSNTYVEASRLEEVLAPIEVAIDEGKVGIVSIATRPDTLPDWSLKRLSKLAERVPVWVELGLETANDEVLEKIKRYHTAAEFMEGAQRCHDAGLKTVGHAILGLPGDGREGARKSAELLAEAGCEGVKVHNLMVLRKTELAKWWRDGKVDILDPETYVAWLADFTERLLPTQVLHRITGDAPLEERLAPRWDLYKNAIREMLAAELEKRGTRQGSLHA
jgi:radical SAM protein (TIGR01212 family)